LVEHALLDDLVRSQQQRLRDREAERLRCLQVDNQFEFRGLLGGPEVFDFPLLTYTFGGEPAGAYTWYAVLTPPGADPMNPANWLSLADAHFTKQ
jgi:hypothetical protein